MRSRLAGVLVVLVMASGCSGGGGDGGDEATATTAGEATTTTATATTGAGATATTAPANGPQVEHLVLRQADFPAGWTVEPADEGGDDDSADDALEACLGIEVDDRGRPEADSEDFTSGEALTQVSSSAELAPDQAAVDAEFAAIRGPKFLTCAARAFDRAVAEDGGGLDIAPSRAEALTFPNVGDGAVAARLSTTLTAEGQQLPIFVDLVFVRKGLAELSFSFVNAGEPFPDGLATELVGKVVARA